ncbi:MAG: hypothetical protein SO445_00415 [Lachnospiraceae bacterium]|mgnify:CR=1 FL=1|nr:hypothetical protein [Lachnospiraceae bacterium]MDD6183854.1 hypothetical protein [Lachnospiraceae bacterium]MDD7377772.1 hypothetical protein [Lachnospiraceae bacterium]MDY4616167.1 hypothetical protein [Lachnospiraceae bacterium]MDY5775096.1 hypothetical protein [Lachnospiraceae bacterium]
MKSREYFKGALYDKKVPILVLDQKWHRLFAIHGKSEEIKQFEEELNGLLARQGQANQDIKDLKKVKNNLMESIVANMDGKNEENQDPVLQKKMEENKRLINEVNEKIEACEDELLELPKQIKEKNEDLMLASMDFCYDKLRTNNEEIEEIAAWIKQMRIDLKKNIIKKQNREINSKEIYSYMHDIFGAQIIDIFDLKQEEQETDSNESKEGGDALP